MRSVLTPSDKRTERITTREAANIARKAEMAVLLSSLADAMDDVRRRLPDGWDFSRDALIRTGLTWTATVRPVSTEAVTHAHRVTGRRLFVQGQGDTPEEALAEVAERLAVNIDPRLMVRRLT